MGSNASCEVPLNLAFELLKKILRGTFCLTGDFSKAEKELVDVRADCLATNTEYCDRCTHAATQATNVARIKTEGTKGLLQGQMAG
jgi:hypothetical protein